MSSILVAYFSASGVTKGKAELLAKAAGADLFEIVPAVPYTEADLDWRDKTSRSTVEMNDPASRPAVAGKVENMAQYDVIFAGYPVWWYKAPTILNTFLEDYDLSGKKIIPFATSGSSPMGDTAQSLLPSLKGAELCEGKRLSGCEAEEIAAWVKELL